MLLAFSNLAYVGFQFLQQRLVQWNQNCDFTDKRHQNKKCRLAYIPSPPPASPVYNIKLWNVGVDLAEGFVFQSRDIKTNKDADLTTQMHRLICAVVVRIWQNRFCHNVASNVSLDCADARRLI